MSKIATSGAVICGSHPGLLLRTGRFNALRALADLEKAESVCSRRQLESYGRRSELVDLITAADASPEMTVTIDYQTPHERQIRGGCETEIPKVFLPPTGVRS